jgi:hypothetical protein
MAAEVAEHPNAHVEAGTLVRMFIPAAGLGTGSLSTVGLLKPAGGEGGPGTIILSIVFPFRTILSTT